MALWKNKPGHPVWHVRTTGKFRLFHSTIRISRDPTATREGWRPRGGLPSGTVQCRKEEAPWNNKPLPTDKWDVSGPPDRLRGARASEGGGGAMEEGTRAGRRGGEARSIPLEACHCWVTLLKLVDVSQSKHADM